MAVTTETAIVYRGGGRRWFTLEAACRAEANRAIVSRAKRLGWYDNRGDEDFLSIPDEWWSRGRRLLAYWHKATFKATALSATASTTVASGREEVAAEVEREGSRAGLDPVPRALSVQKGESA